jgi:formylglycine-generating enzyme required for sulfatase activity
MARALLALASLTLPLLPSMAAERSQANNRFSLPAGAEFRDCADCPALVVIPPGQFTMGAEGGEEGRPEGPPRRVHINYYFAAGKFEITNREIEIFLRDTGHEMPQSCNDWDPVKKTIRLYPERNWRDPGYGRPVAPEEPVVCLSWTDARAYINYLARKTGQNYRFLSEAEWEYLAHDRRATRYGWGDDAADACRVANVYDQAHIDAGYSAEAAPCDDGYAKVAPVGRFLPNSFGLHDVTGNVWEWVEDCYRAPYPANVPSDGRPFLVEGACDRRAARGGSWRSAIFRQRPPWRGRDPETLVSNIFGLRIARSLTAR